MSSARRLVGLEAFPTPVTHRTTSRTSARRDAVRGRRRRRPHRPGPTFTPPRRRRTSTTRPWLPTPSTRSSADARAPCTDPLWRRCRRRDAPRAHTRAARRWVGAWREGRRRRRSCAARDELQRACRETPTLGEGRAALAVVPRPQALLEEEARSVPRARPTARSQRLIQLPLSPEAAGSVQLQRLLGTPDLAGVLPPRGGAVLPLAAPSASTATIDLVAVSLMTARRVSRFACRRRAGAVSKLKESQADPGSDPISDVGWDACAAHRREGPLETGLRPGRVTSAHPGIELTGCFQPMRRTTGVPSRGEPRTMLVSTMNPIVGYAKPFDREVGHYGKRVRRPRVAAVALRSTTERARRLGDKCSRSGPPAHAPVRR